MDQRIEDRAAGAVLASACGDALGAGYEFGPPMPGVMPVRMKGGGGFDWAPGEWTDDTSMAIPILRVVARGVPLEGAALDEVAAAWIEWSKEAPDVGNQTRAVCDAATAPTAEALGAAARAFADAHPNSAGNGSLMRTTPVALAHLDDPRALVAAARRVSDLTHADPLAGDACVLWSLAIRSAITTGEPRLRDQLGALPRERREYWSGLIDAAEEGRPNDFPKNGWAGAALQGAWSAITRGSGVRDVLERAVRGGNDTDTVAAIAGGVIGAMHGASAVPEEWRRIVHGWPGLTADDLVELAVAAVRGRRVATTVRPEQVLLQAVRVLHERGYEALHVWMAVYATGHWRCLLVGDGGRGPEHLRYTTGRQWDLLDDGRVDPIGPEELADRILAAHPGIEADRRPAPAYRFWYAALLEHAGDRVPYMADDYESPWKEGRVALSGPDRPGLLGRSFPLPPEVPPAA
ncbi:ADP-ribosylglycohydrolase family protein [Amnibacterium setariae]|uniref:ADP-ribosylglycohydrolase family protein n=1 Tax=Amnibacterium setariae TaxID=2306585 RepID=A0A3A1TZ43_9MICO|nr:ADP-ribosylglycohydrolase family protein [Amnibacterium setariae]RIX28868.1 ADP-ribosylglycohydrolase family protein [Amnibacterium setariae]